MARHLVAVIDDDPVFLNLMNDVLNEFGYEPVLWLDVACGEEMIGRKSPDLVILDMLFGHEPLGLTLLHALRAAPATVALPVIVCSAAVHIVREHAETLRRLSHAVCVKPISLDTLQETIICLLRPEQRGLGYYS